MRGSYPEWFVEGREDMESAWVLLDYIGLGAQRLRRQTRSWT